MAHEARRVSGAHKVADGSEARVAFINVPLSDLGGIRPRVYDGTALSVFRELMSALEREKHRPTLQNLIDVYSAVAKTARKIKRTYSQDLFDTRPFTDLRYAAQEAAELYVASLTP